MGLNLVQTCNVLETVKDFEKDKEKEKKKDHNPSRSFALVLSTCQISSRILHRFVYLVFIVMAMKPASNEAPSLSSTVPSSSFSKVLASMDESQARDDLGKTLPVDSSS